MGLEPNFSHSVYVWSYYLFHKHNEYLIKVEQIH